MPGRASQSLWRQIGFRMQLVLASTAILISGSIANARGQSAEAGAAIQTPAEQQHPIHGLGGEVSAPAVVHDRRTGELIVDLPEKNFHVFDNGIEQNINHFGLGGEPLSIVLLVETSSHVEPMLPAIRRAGIVFTDTVIGKTGEAAVLGYDDEVTVIEPFTSNSDQLQKTINQLPVGTSGIRLHDAMARGISMLKERPLERRRVLMIIGEAQDSGSGASLGAVLRMAEVTNVMIYCVKLSITAAEFRQPVSQYEPLQVSPKGIYSEPLIKMRPPGPETEQASRPNMNLGALLAWMVKTGKDAAGSNPLALSSAATGGLNVNTTDDRSIQKAVDEIGGELHVVYTIGYRPPDNEPTGFHSIKVTVDRKGVIVRTRPGYYLAPPKTSANRSF
jgi:VWFA-related protein